MALALLQPALHHVGDGLLVVEVHHGRLGARTARKGVVAGDRHRAPIHEVERIRPASLGQASRIPGVNPADIAVLILYLK